MMYNTDTGIMGMLTTSRVATGEKVGIRFEVQGTNGYIRFDQERMNELEVYIKDDPALSGTRCIKLGPQHGQFKDVCAAQGLCISWVDLMTIQAVSYTHLVTETSKDSR